MIETSETFDLAVVLEHRGRLGHGASAVGGERLGIRATGHLGQGAVAYRRQRERQHNSTIPRGHRGLRPAPSQADASHRGWRSSRSAAMATCRMAAFRPALCRANEACGVKNAATRKYLTADWLWYWPPGEMVERMAEYTKNNGKPTSRPYFSIDGHTEITAERWDSLRAVWNHVNGLTNVWSRPPLHNGERLKGTLQRSAPPTRCSAAPLRRRPSCC